MWAAPASSTYDAATLSINTAVAATVSRPTFVPNTGSTAIPISTDTAQTPNVYSASGTIQPAVSVPTFNVSSVAPSSSASVRTASSNFTLPSATATATWPANFVIQGSNPYSMQSVETTDLPTFYWSLQNESTTSRELICAQQTKFCDTAGCAEEGAMVNVNFCNTETMGTRCTCDKGSSNLQQWKWPVQMSDCLTRGSACNNACMQPGGTTAERQACKTACNSAFSDTCGFPGQYAANYAVDKENQKPGMTMVQGGTAGDGALSLQALTGATTVVLACAIALFLV